jgi:hypothetical protein
MIERAKFIWNKSNTTKENIEEFKPLKRAWNQASEEWTEPGESQNTKSLLKACSNSQNFTNFSMNNSDIKLNFTDTAKKDSAPEDDNA